MLGGHHRVYVAHRVSVYNGQIFYYQSVERREFYGGEVQIGVEIFFCHLCGLVGQFGLHERSL